jgi:hypothetical protein
MLISGISGETKRKFESVYAGGTMDTSDSGKVFQYWHCCGSEDPFDAGCTAALTVHMIENLMFTLCSRDCVILSRINSFFAVS